MLNFLCKGNMIVSQHKQKEDNNNNNNNGQDPMQN